MKTALLIASLIAPQARAAYTAQPAPSDSSPAAMQFERLRSILGAWESKTKSGKPVLAWYKLISGGTTLHETLKFQDEPEMVTVFHLNAGNLEMTHYCSANNQPRMRAVPPSAKKPEDIKKVEFDFIEATNLSSPQAGHMNKMKVEFTGPDTFTETWVWNEGGKQTTHAFKFTRVKPADAPKN